jgi:hypothetical protein
MRVLNENIAREANQEDNCTGRFWAVLRILTPTALVASMHIGNRFKSQAILDESALAACMAYIDLNPIRVGLAKTPEASTHTSIQKRIKQACASKVPNRFEQKPPALLPFVGNPRVGMQRVYPFA